MTTVIPLANVRTQPLSRSVANIDSAALAAALKARVQGEVRFDDATRALYATDGSNYRMPPIGVVIPRTKEDIINAVAVCREFGAPLLSRGGGTSLAGQCCNTAVILDMSKYYNQVLDVDPERKLARVQPGVYLDTLRAATTKHGLTFAPDPSTHSHCTLGGMIGNNSCGVHSVMAGRTADNVEELEILTYDGLIMKVGRTSDDELGRLIAEGGRKGEIYAALKALRDKYGDEVRQRYPKIPRRVSGYNLDDLLPENGFHLARALVGSEGTCMVVLEATVNLVPNPPCRTLVVLGYPDVYTAGDHVTELMEYGPIGLEGFDDRLVQDMYQMGLYIEDVNLLPKGHGWLMVEFGGDTQDQANDNASRMVDALRGKSDAPDIRVLNDPHEQEQFWKVREAGLGATAHVPNQAATWGGWEDTAVPPAKVGDYLRDFRALLDRYNYACSLYGHLGQGCVHLRIDFDLASKPGIDKYLAFSNDIADMVVSYGGSLSGEHGDGQSRAAMLPKMFGDNLIHAFEEFKTIWDPEWKMNPGKVVDANRPDDDLRLGANYAPWQPKTHFSFPMDSGSFSEVSLRCVGVGQCRRLEGGTMCPSYMVTREEKHSTRGRARLLFEMLQGQLIGKNGWKDEAVKDALDLCLACKGCKGDCPVHVDMATYKAEFLSHYYEGKPRPRSAYAFGLIFIWARLAAIAPKLVNATTHLPVLRTIAKWMAGIAPEREIPPFAEETFVSWFRRRGVRNIGATRVLLWPDTFNNYFHPETAKAAVEVLEHAGLQVDIPQGHLCCGRPLYDYGMLDQAKRQLREILSSLRQEIRAGTMIIGLEPSCVAVFRDELHNLFPNDPDAKRLQDQTLMLGEYLAKHADDMRLPHMARKALLHGHCHHKSVLDFGADQAVLKRLGIEYTMPETGCCGMAGGFGYEEGEHYRVSIAAGERVLLPKVREATGDTLIITDGFSCREQVLQTTNREPMHLAEVIRMGLDIQEEPVPAKHSGRKPVVSAKMAGAGTAAVLGGLALWRLLQRRNKGAR